MKKWVVLLVLIFCSMASRGYASEPADTIVLSETEEKQMNFHRWLLSIGAINRLDSHIAGSAFAEIHVQLLRNIFLGLYTGIERISIDCSTDSYSAIVDGTDVGVSILYMMPPKLRWKRIDLGLWGQVGYHRLSGNPSLLYESEEKTYNPGKYRLNPDFLKCDLGMYIKWRGIYLATAYSLSNIDMHPYGSGRKSGVFRKPSLHGLSLMIRFGI